jgi:translocation and assembly module TamB
VLGLDELAALAAEQNDVAIVAGKRITEDLYVRYSYNALSAVSALIIRYHLSDRWRLEATNDVNSSMDLLYEFSR